MLSEKYGWTPSQIREQDHRDIISYTEIIREKDALEKYYKKKYGRK